MTEELNELAIELRSIFANLHRNKCEKVRFEKHRDRFHNLTGFSFAYPANWPEATYKEFNIALLSLHHGGYILYGGNTITLKGKLLEVELVNDRN